MAKFKCPYCGALSDKDGICRECDIGRVVPLGPSFAKSRADRKPVSPFIPIILVAALFFFFPLFLGLEFFAALFLLSFAEFCLFFVFLIHCIVRKKDKRFAVTGMILCVITALIAIVAFAFGLRFEIVCAVVKTLTEYIVSFIKKIPELISSRIHLSVPAGEQDYPIVEVLPYTAKWQGFFH